MGRWAGTKSNIDEPRQEKTSLDKRKTWQRNCRWGAPEARRRGASMGSMLGLCLFLLGALLLAITLLKMAPVRSERRGARQYVFRTDPVAVDLATAEGEVGQSVASPAATTTLTIREWHYVPELSSELARFETVFWEPDDTASLRQWIVADQPFHDAAVLEIGTGTGLLAAIAARVGARKVVATDINPVAVANARYNMEHLGLSDLVEIRPVSPENPAPFAVIGPDERFDFIFSNPPWEDGVVGEPAAYALYDPGFQLLDALLQEAPAYLTPQGELILVYGATTPIRRILQEGPKRGWEVILDDPRSVEELPDVFLPGMMLRLRPQASEEQT
ncbi:MAG: hypothetical protein KatS3mg111_0009 [Pirellulaceae bacterium]|nr:MAG: hypothetical protein KatS3mg111_0009 [Pirellulaceae bacterium]